MKRRAVRLTLVILFAGAVAATAYFLATTESRLRSDASAARDFDTRAVHAARATLDLRAAQQAYVAAGQGDEFWIAKVAAALPELSAAVAGLRLTATSAEAQTSLDAATAALHDFEQMDRRAREYTSNGQRLLASDLIFTDGIELTAAIARGLDTARTADSTAQDASIAALRNTELAALAACAGFGVLVMLLLAPVGAKEEPADIPSLPAMRGFDRPDDTPLDTLDLAFTLDDKPAPAPAPAPGTVALAPAPPPLDLSSVASLCTDLARVVDTQSLPALLERTAAILDAPGIVVWIADPDGRELSPTIAHGYAPHVLGRLGVIARDAENATAAAFRTGLVQTVKADSVSNGAIAAPLVTPGGAVGVMAAEVRGEGEQQPAKLAAAAIVAAQLATLVGPPASRASNAEAAG